MRHIPIFLIIFMGFIFFAYAPVVASDAILGTVVSVDQENSKMSFRLIDADNLEDAAAADIITVYLPPRQWCENIKAGKQLRIWGNFESAPSHAFNATQVRGKNFSIPGQKSR